MNKFIIPIISVLTIFLILFNVDPITDFLSKMISNNGFLTIDNPNEYTKDYDFYFVRNSKDYIPYSYNDLMDIIYSVINKGWLEFSFYCPKEYTNCVKDILELKDDETTLNHINNYVHPYNSFSKLKVAVLNSGEINVTIEHLYKKEEIDAINKYVDKVITDLYKKDDDINQNIKRIHDYIINNTKYDKLANKKDAKQKYKSGIAYGPAIEGYATCNGYADLMAIILSKLDIENYKIATTSEEISYESDGHIWNAVNIDNKWLHLDLTWDDPVSNDGKEYLYHKYFLVTTEEMMASDKGNVKIEEHNFNKAIYQEFSDYLNN